MMMVQVTMMSKRISAFTVSFFTVGSGSGMKTPSQSTKRKIQSLQQQNHCGNGGGEFFGIQRRRIFRQQTQRFDHRGCRSTIFQQKRYHMSSSLSSLSSSSSSSSSSSDVDPSIPIQIDDDIDVNVTDMTGWTVQNVVSMSIEQLQRHNVTEAASSVYHLLSTALGLSWESGYRDVASGLHSNRVMSSGEAESFGNMLKRRLEHEPIQYIVGQWDFLDYTITIRPPLLCPRPETEELVMKVLEDPATTESPISILDVGCGTGVIGLALAHRHLDATVDAIDIDPVAVTTSIENSRRILLDPTEQKCYHVSLSCASTYNPTHKYDIIVSNPPYIPRRDMATLSADVVRYESDGALCGGDDGMDVIRTIIRRLPDWCHPGGVCWMEVDPSHPKLIQKMLEKHEKDFEEHRSSDDDDVFGDDDASPPIVFFDSSHNDMFGCDRFVKLVVR
jgi:release factor glutamine methyltransferase